MEKIEDSFRLEISQSHRKIVTIYDLHDKNSKKKILSNKLTTSMLSLLFHLRITIF